MPDVVVVVPLTLGRSDENRSEAKQSDGNLPPNLVTNNHSRARSARALPLVPDPVQPKLHGQPWGVQERRSEAYHG